MPQLQAEAAWPRNQESAGMVFIPGGTFPMGSDRHYPEEAPVHCARLSPFWIDKTPTPGGRQMASTWQGMFPSENLEHDGYRHTSPVMAFPANGYGVYDMIGNVWEWTGDWCSERHEAAAAKACCIPENPRGGPEAASHDPALPSIVIPRKVLKGGSHLRAPNYCRRYRPAARHAEPVDTSTNHVGFHCVVRETRAAR